MDATQTEKIYVAVGYDIVDGFQTLRWALRKWNPHSISIVILHVKYNTSKNYVETLLGKLPVEGACEQKLARDRKYEQRIINKLLSEYIALCDNVPAETFEVGKFDEPMHRRTIDLILGLGITKLIMGFSFMKPSLKSKVDINGLFYVHQHKPAFCDLFIICEGKQVSPRLKNNDIILEDDNGAKIARTREKINFRDWPERTLIDKTIDFQQTSSCGSFTSSPNFEFHINQNQWEFSFQGIENYLQELMSLNSGEGSSGLDNEFSHIGPTEPYAKECDNSNNTSGAEKIEILKDKLNEAYKTIQMKRKDDVANLERHEKAEWAIYLCNRREEELESLRKEEVTRREEVKKEVDAEKEQVNEIRMDVEESKKMLRSVGEQKTELLNRLHKCRLAVSQAETELGKALGERTKMLMEIDNLRRQRDVQNRRIKYFKEKDAIRMSGRMMEIKDCNFREYTKDEILLATRNFSDQLRLKSSGNSTNVYRGQINHSTVAIKILTSLSGLSQLDFQAKVTYLGSIRQPHLVSILGFCSEPKCLVLEYMHSGSLEEMLFGSRGRALSWHDSIRIAIEVCSGLDFLNSAQPEPTGFLLHSHPSPSKILLDSNLVAKITGFGLHESSEESNVNVKSDRMAIGLLLQNLLTGRRNLVTMDREEFFDEIGEQWPLDVAKQIVGLARTCMSMNPEPNGEMSITRVVKELNEIIRKGEDIVTRERWKAIIDADLDVQDSTHVPCIFICPILQKIMKNPYVAADGFSYELEAIEKWLQSGNELSPKKLRLKHRLLTPNHTLRSLIEDWQSKRSAKVAI